MFMDYQITADLPKNCLNEVIEYLTQNRDRRAPLWMACLNPHSYVVALSDRLFERSLKNADWLLPDGVGIVLASKIFRNSLKKRFSGPDFFLGLNELLNLHSDCRVFFLGSSESTLEMIVDKMLMDYPNISIAGSYSPPYKSEFSKEDNAEIIEVINSSKADILWVGMTAPKQEKWIYSNKKSLDVKFIGAIGAVFDFYAGKTPRAPKLIRKFGLEWLFRLAQEPFRLWRRTLVSVPIFFYSVCKEKIKNFLKYTSR